MPPSELPYDHARNHRQQQSAVKHQRGKGWLSTTSIRRKQAVGSRAFYECERRGRHPPEKTVASDEKHRRCNHRQNHSRWSPVCRVHECLVLAVFCLSVTAERPRNRRDSNFHLDVNCGSTQSCHESRELPQAERRAIALYQWLGHMCRTGRRCIRCSVVRLGEFLDKS